MQATLPPFHETQYGYVSHTRDHSYVITFNGIDYDVTHYWHESPDGELIVRGTTTPAADARKHYETLMLAQDCAGAGWEVHW